MSDSEKESGLNRRSFFKKVGIAALGLASGAINPLSLLRPAVAEAAQASSVAKEGGAEDQPVPIEPELLFDNLSPGAYPEYFKPYLEIKVNQTTQNAIDNLPYPRETIIGEGLVENWFPAPFRDTLVITAPKQGGGAGDNEGMVVYKKFNTVTESRIHPSLEKYLNLYGTPDVVKKGSTEYGPHQTFYIYASKGFMLSANPFTYELDEIHVFLPTTIDDYMSKWGHKYISANPRGPEILGP